MLSKLAKVMEQIVKLINKIDEMCVEVASYLARLQEALKKSKGLFNLAKLQRARINFVVRQGAGYAIDGKGFTGPVGAGYDVATGLYKGPEDAQHARQQG